MTRRMGSAFLGALILCASLTAPASGSAGEAENVRVIKRFPFKGGLELASSDDYVYASQWNGHYARAGRPKWGGVHIFDVSGAVPRKTGFLHCPGFDNDVAVVKPGLIALGYAQNVCATNPTVSGILLADVSDPTNPRVLGDTPVYFAHTIAAYPGKPLVYAATGGWLPIGNEGRNDIVDVSDPRHPKVVGSFVNRGYGCHDFSFSFANGSKLGFCTTSGTEQFVLDVSDPRDPVVVGTIVNPLIQYGHTPVASPDGKLLAITDEAFVAHECSSGLNPIGATWIYDISDPANPQLQSYVPAPAGKAPAATLIDWLPAYCSAAMIDWVPGTSNLVVSWYSGGVEVLDVRDPGEPQRMAFYRPKNALPYGVDYYRGRLYVNDINRGVEVLEVQGITR